MVEHKLIVGIDPGTTLGLALLDLRGKPILVDSYRGISRTEIISIISSKGNPAVIAVDVQRPSQIAEYLAAKFNAEIFFFPTLISTSEKMALARDFASRYCTRLPEDQHQSDALAAAVKALNFYKDKFQRIDAQIKQMGIHVSADRAKQLVVDGFSVAESIRFSLEHGKQKPKLSPPSAILQDEPNEIQLLLRKKIRNQNLIISKIKRLCERKDHDTRTLAEKNELLKARIAEITTEHYLQIKTEYEYSKLKRELQHEKERIQRLIQQLESSKPQARTEPQEMKQGDSEILKIIPSFTENDIQRTAKTIGIWPGDVVLLRDASGGGKTTARQLIDRNIKAVLVSSKLSHLAFEELTDSGVPVIDVSSVPIEWSDNGAYIKVAELDRAIYTFKRLQNSEKEQGLERLFHEYRAEKS
ncbi:MAG: DUF460 domain-containing protein [Candidatus Bathyarchaeia archaeon]